MEQILFDMMSLEIVGHWGDTIKSATWKREKNALAHILAVKSKYNAPEGVGVWGERTEGDKGWK